MSRIILKEHPGTDEHHIVVGWDRPCASYFWQEFNKEPEVTHDEDGWYVDKFNGTKTIWNTQVEAEEHKWDDWEEMVRFAGYMPNELPTLKSFLDSLPPDIKPLVTDEVQELLVQHSMDTNAGSILVNMAPKSWKVEVETFTDPGKWASNSIRLATKQEAVQYGDDLMMRWTQVQNLRAVESTDPVNYRWEHGKAVAV